LLSTYLFTNVGRFQGEEGTIPVSSWEQALSACEEDDWFQLTDWLPNEVFAEVSRKAKSRYQEWNQHVQAIEKRLKPWVDSQVQLVSPNLAPQNLEIFHGRILWELMHATLETEYGDIISKGFFSVLAGWYLRGHFPCGWKGEYPDGRLVVF